MVVGTRNEETRTRVGKKREERESIREKEERSLRGKDKKEVDELKRAHVMVVWQRERRYRGLCE